MSNNEKNDNQEFDFSKEIESPIEVDTESISESVKTFTGPEDTHSMEEMEYYEDEEAEAGNESAGSSIEENGEEVHPDTENDAALLNQETKVAMDTSQIIHRKGNSGVIPNLELLPTDSIRIPADEIAETIVVPERKTVSESVQKNADDKEASETEVYEEEVYEEVPAEETYDGETAEDASHNEKSIEESKNNKATGKDKTKKAPKKVHQDIELLPGDEIDDDVPVSKEEAEALGDLSYHDEDVKKKKTNKEKTGEKHPTGGNKPANHSNGKNHTPEAHARNSKGSKPEKKQKKKAGVFDILLVVGAIVAVLVICLLTISFVSKTKKNTQYETLASAGNDLMSIGNIGQKGIEEIVANKTTTVVETVSEEPESEKPSEEKKERKDVSVNFSSVEKDLKIKFSDKQTDALIKGVLFRVEARTPDEKTVTWEDSDKDGIIYMENITPGKYYVKILNVEDYVFPETESEVTVKDKISYTAINVVNEIKKEKDVNVAAEDKGAKTVDTGVVLSDTVGWVDSSQKTVYTEITKDKIAEPQAMLTESQSSYNAEPSPDDDDPDDGGNTNPDPVVHKVTTLNLSASSLSLSVGDNAGLSASATDEEGNDISVSLRWSTADPNVATVDENGIVTAKGPGGTTISCRAKDDNGNKVTSSCYIDVSEALHYVTGVTISVSPNTSFRVGETGKISASVSTDGAGVDTSVNFVSSDNNVVSVSSDGTITANAEGSATITVSTSGKRSDGSPATAECTITVSAAKGYVSAITLDKDTLGLSIGASEKLNANVQTEGGDADTSVTWSSSDESIATVSSDGTVTAVAKGKATITCKTTTKSREGKKLSATCKVTVNTAMNDTTTPLTYKNADGTVVNLYVKDGENYREAKYADYYKYSVFYLKEVKRYGWQNENGTTKYYTSEGKYVTGEQVIGGVKYNFANDGTLSLGSGTMGIDVSKWNGNIDWNAVRQSGVSFVIIRCGYRGCTLGGLIEDPNFHTYASGAEAAGLKVGVYFFSQAINEREAVEEASMAISMAQRHRISYPIFIDSEYGSVAHNARADGLGKAERTAVCRAFCETIRSAGYTPGVYASKSWYYNNLDAGSLNNYKIWLAHYCTQTDYTGKYELWQSTSKGRINGINGNVDIDTSYLGY